MEKPATDIYTFENLRKGQYTYVDKTRAVSGTKIVREADAAGFEPQ